MSATETSLKPACRMIPSSSSDLTAANCSSRGTFGSMRCNCHSPICSTPSFSRLLIACLRKIVRTPIRLPDARARPPEPSLGRDEHAVIRVERFADELLRDIGPIGIRGVDEIDAELGHALQRPDRLRSVGGRTPDALPVTRMAPKPRRWISISPPILNVPDLPASSFAIGLLLFASSRSLRSLLRLHLSDFVQ